MLNSAAQLTMQIMQKAVRAGNEVEKTFWYVLVREKEKEFGTNWEECPVCRGAHSVHEVCSIIAEEKN